MDRMTANDVSAAMESSLEDVVDEKQYPVASTELQEYNDLAAKFDKKRVMSLLRRVDLHLMPPLTILYIVSFVDRSNIGNARLQNLESDLHLSAQQFAWALTIFFFPYGLFEVPSNVILKFSKPSIWLTVIIFGWGVVMTVTGLVQNYSGLLACRFFLGIFEAGLFPGITFITTTWYKRFEVQYRIAILYAGAAFSGAFSGLLAFAIGKMQGIRGYSSWRWLFILEGLTTCVIAAICYFFIPDSPAAAKWLTTEEARFIELRLQFDGHESGYKESDFQWKYLKQGFSDAKVWMGTIMFTAIFTCTYSLSYTLPTMINLLGYSAATAQLLTIPVYAFACLLCVITSVLSDRNHHRATFFFVPMGLIVVGLIIGLATDPERLPGVVYFAMFLIGGGTFSGGPSTMSWMSNNLAGQWKRAVSMALLATIANLVGGTIGSNIFLAREKPKYTTAYSVLLAFITCAVLSGWALVFMIRRWNAQRTVLIEQAQQEGRDLDAECKDLGDKNPHFKYTL